MTPAAERLVRRRAAAAVARVRDRAAAAIAAVPGVTVEQRGEDVIAWGRRLRARWLDDARLRWLGRSL